MLMRAAVADSAAAMRQATTFTALLSALFCRRRALLDAMIDSAIAGLPRR